MKVLVIGRHGQVATSLAERATRHADVEMIYVSRTDADLSSSGSVADAIRILAPELVINAGAYTAVDKAEEEPALAFRINGEGAGEAAAAAHELGAPIIHLSTDYVFDGTAAEPYREDAAVNPLSVYGRSKLAGEEAVRAANPRHLILRTAWVYGPYGHNFVKTMIKAASEHDVLTVVDDQFGSPTSAIDLAEAILNVVDRINEVALGQTYHLAGSGSATWYGVATEVMLQCKRLGLPDATVRPISTADWPTKAVRPQFAILDCSKAERDLGVRLPEWRTSVAAAVERLATQILA